MKLTPGYKQTEVGVIPEEWQVRRLGELGGVVRGGSPRPAGDPRYFDGDFIPWLTVAALTNISENQLRVTDTVGFLTEEGAKHSRILASGTLIIANSGATLGVAKFLGVTCCANDGIAAIINQKAGDKEFVCRYINSRTKHLREVVATGNGQPNLNTTLIREIPIPFPPLPEQRAIAGALSDVDALIGALDQLIAKKRDLKQAAMQQLLTGQKRLPGIYREWEARRLGDVGVFSKGRGIKKDEVVADGLPCVRYGEIYTHYNDHLKTFNSFIASETAKQSQRIQKGDLLFAGSGETAEEIGKCIAFLGDEEVYAGGDIVIFRPVGQDSKFLGFLMNHSSVSSQKARLGQGDAVVHISARNLARLELHLPALPEQTAIAEVLSDMDAELAALRQRRDKTRALKQGMMQELLTGRTRIV
jgi:type I restriction enzyme S subunit